jgi:hypothetical protein
MPVMAALSRSTSTATFSLSFGVGVMTASGGVEAKGTHKGSLGLAIYDIVHAR